MKLSIKQDFNEILEYRTNLLYCINISEMQMRSNLSVLLEASANPTREKILRLLKDKPMTPTEILRELRKEERYENLVAPLLTNHLKVLYSSGLVDYEQKGRNRIYSLNSESVGKILEFFNLLALKEDMENDSPKRPKNDKWSQFEDSSFYRNR